MALQWATLTDTRDFVPVLGRLLTKDPIGQAGGPNLYAYCDNSPLTKIDPDGKDWKSWWYRHITEPVYGWGNALHATAGFATGLGPTSNGFDQSTVQGRQMKNSSAGVMISMALIDADYLRGSRSLGIQDSAFGRKSPGAGHMVPFLNTVTEPSNGTQAQVGGFTWRATRTGRRINVTVTNFITLKSLAYHWGGLNLWGFSGWDRAGSGFGPLGRVRQEFRWTVPVPKGFR